MNVCSREHDVCWMVSSSLVRLCRCRSRKKGKKEDKGYGPLVAQVEKVVNLGPSWLVVGVRCFWRGSNQCSMPVDRFGAPWAIQSPLLGRSRHYLPPAGGSPSRLQGPPCRLRSQPAEPAMGGAASRQPRFPQEQPQRQPHTDPIHLLTSVPDDNVSQSHCRRGGYSSHSARWYAHPLLQMGSALTCSVLPFRSAPRTGKQVTSLKRFRDSLLLPVPRQAGIKVVGSSS